MSQKDRPSQLPRDLGRIERPLGSEGQRFVDSPHRVPAAVGATHQILRDSAPDGASRVTLAVCADGR